MSNLYGLDLELPDIGDGELVTDVVTIVRTVVPDRPAQDCLYLGGTPHTGGIVQLGMLTAALDYVRDDEEDDQ